MPRAGLADGVDTLYVNGKLSDPWCQVDRAAVQGQNVLRSKRLTSLRSYANLRRITARSHSQLEERLTLLSWLHEMLGYANTNELLDDIRPTDEGFDGNGRSYVYARLASRAGRLRGVTTPDLRRFDDNLRDHLAAMNERRTLPITLRYFQYLAALYTEMFSR